MFHRSREPFISYIDAEHKHAPRRAAPAMLVESMPPVLSICAAASPDVPP